MKKLQKLATMALTAVLLSSLTMTDVFASSVISSVSIRVESNLEAGGSLPSESEVKLDAGLSSGENGVAVYSSSSKYKVEQVDWLTNTREISVGDTPKMKVYLQPSNTNDYYFKGSYGSSNITVKGGSYVSSRREDDQLVVTIKMDPIKGEYDPPEDPEWRDSGLGRAVWDDSNGNTSKTYDVYLYRGSSNIKKVEGLKATSYNFYPYMTKEGTYYFKVRTVPPTNSNNSAGKKSEWAESDEIYISKEDVSDGSGQTDGNGSTVGNNGQVGWVKDGDSWFYKFPNGSYQKDSWFQVNGKWYLFDSSGRMMTGWQTKNGNTYLLKDSGEMCTGWYQKDGYWYYLNQQPGGTEGVAVKNGWAFVGGKWYLMDATGRMMTGWQTKNGNSYYFNDAGDMFKGWLKSGSLWYYMCETQTGQFPEGAMCKNSWVQSKGQTYYINQSGAMAEGWNEIGGNWYYFYPNDGRKAVNTNIGDFYVDGQGVWRK